MLVQDLSSTVFTELTEAKAAWEMEFVRARHSLGIHCFIQSGVTEGRAQPHLNRGPTVYTGSAAGVERQRDIVSIHSGRGVAGAGLGICLFISLLTLTHAGLLMLTEATAACQPVWQGGDFLPPSQPPRE